MSPPLVSLGIPLYRSERFLSGLRANCQVLAAEDDVEILVSDRHGADGALDSLRSEWGHDPRFRFLQASDSLSWVEHMNLLLREARGRYFRWMPHDDLFPAGCLRPLIHQLEREPGTVLAYAPTRGIDEDGRDLPEKARLDTCPVRPGETWTLRHSLDLFWRGYCEGAFKGLFRREEVMAAGLFIRPTHELVHAERAWLFGVSLLGGLEEVTDSVYLKRYHPHSTHARWRPGTRHLISTTAVMCGYLRDLGPGPWRTGYGMAYLWRLAAGRVFQRLREGRR